MAILQSNAASQNAQPYRRAISEVTVEFALP